MDYVTSASQGSCLALRPPESHLQGSRTFALGMESTISAYFKEGGVGWLLFGGNPMVLRGCSLLCLGITSGNAQETICGGVD